MAGYPCFALCFSTVHEHSQQVYSNYELGQRDIPTEILIRLSEFYRVSVDYLLGLTDHPERNG